MVLERERFNDTISEEHPLFIILPNGRLFIIKDGRYLMNIVADSPPIDELYHDSSPFLNLGPPVVSTNLNIVSDVICYVEKGGMKKYKQWKEKERRLKLKGGNKKHART